MLVFIQHGDGSLDFLIKTVDELVSDLAFLDATLLRKTKNAIKMNIAHVLSEQFAVLKNTEKLLEVLR